MLQHAIRIPDPYFQVHDRWLVRQLAPDVAKIELPKDDRDKRMALAPALLTLMGHEAANIHVGTRRPEDLERRVQQLGRDPLWFSTAAERMEACTRRDHAEWASRHLDT
jgi:hypothetical protein